MAYYPVSQRTATIAASAALSGAIYVGAGEITAIIMPSSWTTANLTFQGSPDGVTYNEIYDDNGTELTVTAAASTHITLGYLERKYFLGALWVKVRSGTSGSPTNQAAARSITVQVYKTPMLTAHGAIR